MISKWFWCQDGKALKAVTMDNEARIKSGVVGPEGPFTSEKMALLDARREYLETVRLYKSALADIATRLKTAK